MSRKVKLKIEFEIGTLDEIGIGGFKVGWLDAENEGRTYSLTSGSGVGNPLLEGSVSEGKNYVYARADIREMAAALFEEMETDLNAVGTESA